MCRNRKTGDTGETGETLDTGETAETAETAAGHIIWVVLTDSGNCEDE